MRDRVVTGRCPLPSYQWFPDQFGDSKGQEVYGQGLKQTLVELYALPMAQQGDRLESSFAEWQGSEEQVDDVNVLGFKV